MTNDKKIEDYLHLYLGCPCDFFIRLPEGFTAIGERTSLDIRVLHNVLNGLATCKPILRPLSDMSEEETLEIGIYYQRCNCSNPDNTCIDGQHPTIIEWEPESIMKALSKHFDLFGLIETGLAIDATTLKQ